MYVGKSNTLLFDTITRGVRWVEVRREVAAVPAEEVITYTWGDWADPIATGVVFGNVLNPDTYTEGINGVAGGNTYIPGGAGASNGASAMIYTFADGQQIAARAPIGLGNDNVTDVQSRAFYRSNKNGGTWQEWDDTSNPIPAGLITTDINNPSSGATLTYYPATGYPSDHGITVDARAFGILLFDTLNTSETLYGPTNSNAQGRLKWTRTGTVS